MSRRIVTPHGTWVEAESRGQFKLQPARQRGGLSGPLKPGNILRSKLVKSIGQLVREVFPLDAYHSDRIMTEEVTITFKVKPKSEKKIIGNTEFLRKGFLQILEEDDSDN